MKLGKTQSHDKMVELADGHTKCARSPSVLDTNP
jgi:hypothetical protein